MAAVSLDTDQVFGDSCEPTLLRTLQADQDTKLTCCIIVPGHQQVATSSEDGSLTLWPLVPGRPRPMRLQSKQGPLTCVAASASGDLLATASSDATVNIWQNRSGKQVPAERKLHFSPVRACDISFDGRLLLTASDDKSVKLSALASRGSVASFTGHLNWVRSAVLSGSAAFIASGSDDKTVQLWDTETRSAVKVWHDCGSSVTSVRFGQNEGIVAASTWDSSINLWDARSHALRQHYGRAHGGPITQLAFHPMEEVLLSSSADKTLRLWDLRAGRLRNTISGHDGAVLACSWDAQGAMFASCDWSRVHLWRLGSGEVVPAASRSVGRGEQISGWNPAKQAATPLVPAMTRDLATKTMPQPQKVPVITVTAQSAKGFAPGLKDKGQDLSPNMSEDVARAVEQIVSQMGLLTRSLESLEARMLRVEAASADVAELLRARAASTAAATAECTVRAMDATALP